MQSFKYIARDLTGQRREGQRQAISATEVLSWLREQGFTPVSVSEIKSRVKKAKTAVSRKRIKSGELAALCWQLTTMVEGGIPITAALDTISEDIENMALQSILQKVLSKMLKGETFSSSLAEFPKVFNQLSRSMVMAGETGGNLSEALRRMAVYFDNRDKMKKKVQGAMAYPAFVICFIILIVVFIMAFIIPRFRVIFDQIGGELPAFTQGFMDFYDFTAHNVVYIIGGVILSILTCIGLYKTRGGHYMFCQMGLKIPLLGKVFSQAFIAVFCRTMSMLLSAGVSVLEVFEILSNMTSNDIIKNAIVETKERIVEGSNVSASMAQSGGFFPNMVVKMTQVGEESGSLTRVLDRTADYYERKVDAMITTLMGLLEPIMIVTVGGIVLVVVLALYLPIFTMTDVK